MIDLTVAAPTRSPRVPRRRPPRRSSSCRATCADDGYRVLGLPELREAVAELYRRRGLPTTVERGDDHERRTGRDRTRLRGSSCRPARRCSSSRRPIRTRSTRSAPRPRGSSRVPVERRVGRRARRVELPAVVAAARVLHARLQQPDRPSDAPGRARRTRPRRAPYRHAADRGRELPRARPRRRPPGRGAARRPRPRARDLGRRAEQERLGRPAHRLGARRRRRSSSGSAQRGRAWTSPTRCSSSSSRCSCSATWTRCSPSGAARLARQLEALADALADELPGWTFARPTAGSASGPRSTARARRWSARPPRAGVRIVPGPRFGIDGTLERFLRLPFVLPPATLREAVSGWPGRRGRASLRRARGRGQLRRLRPCTRRRPGHVTRSARSRLTRVRFFELPSRPGHRAEGPGGKTNIGYEPSGEQSRRFGCDPPRAGTGGRARARSKRPTASPARATTAIRPPRRDEALPGGEQRVHAGGRHLVRLAQVDEEPRRAGLECVSELVSERLDPPQSSMPCALTIAMRTPDETAASSGPRAVACCATMTPRVQGDRHACAHCTVWCPF